TPLLLRIVVVFFSFFFFSSRRRHTRFSRDWSSDVCSSDLCFLSGGAGVGHRCGVRGGRVRRDAVTMSSVRHHYPVPGKWRPTVEIGRASCRERVEIAAGRGTREKTRRKQGQRHSKASTKLY